MNGLGLFFLWEFFITKVEIYFILNNAGCHILEEVAQRCFSEKDFHKQKSGSAEYLYEKHLWGNASDLFMRKVSIFYILSNVTPVKCVA